MSWFHSLTGFHEQSWADTRARFDVDGGMLRSRVNGRAWAIGRGGAFGNERAWIDSATRRALTLARGYALDVRLVSHGAPGDDVRRLVEEFGG